MLGEVRDHRPDDRQVVDALADLRKQVADRDAALAVMAEFPRAAQHVADVVELRRVRLDLDRLPVLAVEPRLGVERVDLRRSAVHEQEDDARGLGRKVRGPGRPADSLSAAARPARGSAARRRRPRRRPARERAPRPPARQSRCRTASSMSRRVSPGLDKSLAMHGSSRISCCGRRKPAIDSVDEDKLFHVDQDMAEIGPGRASALRPLARSGFRACVWPAEERQARAGFLIGRAAGRKRSR